MKAVNVKIPAKKGPEVWDLLAARRARALGVGVLSGGYGEEQLERAGAYRVYQDPFDLMQHLDEIGIRITDLSRSRVLCSELNSILVWD
jgi:hypothetical protein